jgi:hypothetical protein
MTTELKVWLLFDAFTHRQSQPMNEEQTQIAIFSLRIETDRYFVWTPGWPEWKPLENYLKESQCPFKTVPKNPTEKTLITEDVNKLAGLPEETLSSVQIPKNPKNQKVDYGYYHQDVHADDLSIRKINNLKPLGGINDKDKEEKDRRRAERHEFQIEILLVARNGRSFRANSKNISLTGALLDRDIPKDFLNTPFDMVVVNRDEKNPQKSKMHFKGKVVGDLDQRDRLTFVEQDPENHKVFKEMLESYVQQKSVKNA